MSNNLTSTILGVVGGLALGVIGALAFMQGDDKLTKALEDRDAALAQVKHLNNQIQDLTKQLADLRASQGQQVAASTDVKPAEATTAPATDTAPARPAMTINAGALAGAFRGLGGTQQRLLLMKARLKLTPDQEKAVQAAMDAQQQQRRDAMRAMFAQRNGQAAGGTTPATPAAPAAPVKSLDDALSSILTQNQMADYQQLQTDEKTSQANTAATIQVNSMAPLLQMSDAQKDQVFNALYQIQMTAPDPTAAISTSGGVTGAANTFAAQTQATNEALAKILTPDQLALYQQQAAATQMTFGGQGGGRRGGGRNGQGGQGGGGAGGGAATATPSGT